MSLQSSSPPFPDLTHGVMTLVESNLPPNPTSITATSTFFLENQPNPKTVVNSKNVAGIEVEASESNG